MLEGFTPARPCILLTRGVPGSGKTTWTRQWVDEHPWFVRINLDDLRAMMWQVPWQKELEPIVQSCQAAIIAQALTNGLSVVVDNTHIQPYQLNRVDAITIYLRLEAPTIIDFDVPLEVCIERNAQRARQVPVDWVTEMHQALERVRIEERLYLLKRTVYTIKESSDGDYQITHTSQGVVQG